MNLLIELNQAPKDLTGLLWILAAGGAGVIGYLFIRYENLKKDYDKRLDELNKRILDDKDKSSEKYIESLEKTLVTINTLVDSIDNIPDKVVQKTVLQCQANLESVLKDSKNGTV